MAGPEIHDIVRQFHFSPPSGSRLFAVASDKQCAASFLCSLDWLATIVWTLETPEPLPLDTSQAPREVKAQAAQLREIAQARGEDMTDIFGTMSKRLVETADHIEAGLEGFLYFESWAVESVTTRFRPEGSEIVAQRTRENRLEMLAQYGTSEAVEFTGIDAAARLLRAGLDRTRDRFWMILPRQLNKALSPDVDFWSSHLEGLNPSGPGAFD